MNIKLMISLFFLFSCHGSHAKSKMAFVFDGIVYNFSQSIATSEALNKYQFLVRNGLAKLKRMLLYRTLNNWDELNSGHPCSKFKLTDNKNN